MHFPLPQLSNSNHFLDATLAESIAAPTHLLLFVTGKGNLAGMRFIGQETTSVAQMKELIEVSHAHMAPWPDLATVFDIEARSDGSVCPLGLVSRLARGTLPT